MRHAILILGLLFCAIPSRAAITDTGVGCAGTSGATCNSGSLTVQVGDYVYVFASRDATTAPTIPSGYTTIDTASASSSSFRSACGVATSTTWTVGAWTNANKVLIEVYRGVAATTTANCVTAGIGAHTSSSSTTSTISYTGLTLVNATGNSWVIGASGSSAHTCLPSGMSTKQTVAGPVGLLNDTNAGVSSWATTTCTGTTGNSKTDIVELLAQTCKNTVYGNWTCVQTASNTACGTGGTTCAVTVASTGSGHVIVVAVVEVNSTPPAISSVSGGGTYSLCAASGCLSTVSSLDGVDMAYTLNSSSGATTITPTMGATINNSWQVYVTEVAFAAGSVALDTFGVTTGAGANPTGPALSLTGSDDFITQGINTTGSANSITSPYQSVLTMFTGTGFARGFSISSGSAPTWTATSGNSAEDALAIKFTASSNFVPQVGAFMPGP